MRASEVLLRARALIEDEDDWCDGVWADHAGRLCAVGALNAALGQRPAQYCGHDDSEAFLLLHNAACALHVGPEHEPAYIAFVNDEQGHRGALAMYDIAISAALSDEAVDQ